MPGSFVISLDFELHWGVRDKTSVDGYRENLLGVREAIPAMLSLFERRGIAATWATVGFLFAETKREIERHAPSVLPTYADPMLSPYDAMHEVGEDEAHDPFHFAPSLLRRIAKTPRQEIGTHTFSHYYCLEQGQTVAQFDADLAAAKSISQDMGETMKSIVFPRNQVNQGYLDVLARHGVRSYRSNVDHWAYRELGGAETQARRAFRLADAYLPLGGARPHDTPLPSSKPVAVPASAFLRPYHLRAKRLDPLRLWRLTQTMTAAAREDQVFHLWWHPHNFGKHLKESLQFLTNVLDQVDHLRRTRSMESLTMSEAARV